MSRTRTYGQSVIVTAAATAEEAEPGATLKMASDRLSRVLTEQMKLVRVLGVDTDVDSITFAERESEDPLGGVVLGYKLRGRQRRNVLQRILWAIKL